MTDLRASNINQLSEFDKIRNEGRLAYEYVRGSHLYNLHTPVSDVDTGGVFLCTSDDLHGLFGYKPQVSDQRHDNTWYEIGELLRLLMKSNPTVLESLFVPEDKIVGEVHPLMRLILDNRDKFITKQCFNPFFGYAKSQIEKARGLNKKIVNPVERRLSPLDFSYTFRGQGSQPFADWLDKHNLKQRYCGLVNIPNMRDMHAVYYDFGMHCLNETDWKNDLTYLSFASDHLKTEDIPTAINLLESLPSMGYRGAFASDKDGNELRLSSIEKDAGNPICYISFNRDAYSQHCRSYAEYQRWVKERNPERYLANLDKTYDSKNMMHMFRLIHMASEIAEGKGLILERTWDRDFLMDVRNHKFEYDELMAKLEEETEHMNQLMASSTIPERIDTDFVNSLMIEIRKRQFA